MVSSVIIFGAGQIGYIHIYTKDNQSHDLP